MATSLTKPFLGAPHTSTGSLHSPSLLPSRNIIQLPALRSQLKPLGLTTGSPIKVYINETSQACLPRTSELRPVQAAEKSGHLVSGILAKKLIKKYAGTDILAYVSQVHNVVLPESLVDHETLTYDQIKNSTVRCPNPEYAGKMIAAIEAVRMRGDSVGGTITCIVRNFPRSRGSMAFQEIAAVLAKGVMTIPLTKGFEIGSGFTGTLIPTDSEYIDESGQSGGIQSGIIKMRVAVKPQIPFSMRRNAVSREGEPLACDVPRATDLVETVVAKELLYNLIAEGGKCLMSTTNAACHEPLESSESAKA